jgi:hypothetical protein
MLFGPRKWMPISAVNLLWLTDPHDLQGIPTPGGRAVSSMSARKRVSRYLISTAVVCSDRRSQVPILALPDIWISGDFN